MIKYHPFNFQRIKNIINIKALKKNTKNNINNNINNDNYIMSKKKMILIKLAKKYNRSPDYYYKKVINDLINNEPSHFVASFKEYLLVADNSEYIQVYYNKKEIIKFLPLIFEYYHISTVFFPNYNKLIEKKFIYKNIKKKQQLINIQQEQEEKDSKKNNKKFENDIFKNNGFINSENDSSIKGEKILTSHALNSILNQTNTSINRNLFEINKNNNESKELADFIKKLNNEEKKITLKIKDEKIRNKHIICIQKENIIKKHNNKMNNNNNNTLTLNNISTKNNTRSKEKSNINGKNGSIKNIKNIYNFSIINLDCSKKINKNFLLKGKKEKNIIKKILSDISSLNAPNKLINNKFYCKINNNKIKFNKSKETKIKKNNFENETIQIQNYNFRKMKRIKNHYDIRTYISRNKAKFCESTIFVNHLNNSNQNISKKRNNTFKVYTTTNNIHINENKILSIDTDRRTKKKISKNDKQIKDSKIINLIYSKFHTINNSNKTFRSNTKKIFQNKTIKINKTRDKKKNNKNEKSIKSRNIYSPIKTDINPFQSNIYSNPSNRYKKIKKFKLLSSNRDNTNLSTSRLMNKKKKKNIFLNNNKKLQFIKDIKKILKENKSNKIIKRTNFINGSKISSSNNFLTINIDKNQNYSKILKI